MCFLHESDWIARHSEKSSPVATKNARCAECYATIPTGTAYHHLFLQEYDECRDCYCGDCSCDEMTGGCCQCPYPTFGETFDWSCCADCYKFLAAIQEAEEDAGCNGDETRPGLGTMLEDVREGGVEEARRYIRKVRERYPELLRSGYLTRIWKQMFA